MATIAYRVFFAVGLAAAIMTYSFASGGNDPSLLWIIVVGAAWFLAFQFMLNLVFVNGSSRPDVRSIFAVSSGLDGLPIRLCWCLFVVALTLLNVRRLRNTLSEPFCVVSGPRKQRNQME